MTQQTWYYPLGEMRHETKVKGSRFLARLVPIAAEDEAQNALEQVRKEEHTATHNCFAWRIGAGDDEVWRVSDDGEPAGTAGKPIYSVLQGANLTNTLAVVTRYFGGTKLGKGGLIRAYSGVVKDCLPELRMKEFIARQLLVCKTDFEHSNLVYRLVESYGAKILEQSFERDVVVQVQIKKSEADKFAWELRELSHGLIKAEFI